MMVYLQGFFAQKSEIGPKVKVWQLKLCCARSAVERPNGLCAVIGGRGGLGDNCVGNTPALLPPDRCLASPVQVFLSPNCPHKPRVDQKLTKRYILTLSPPGVV
ncbi:UNVERIFIED_CONTAM: hypothetical protein K2H54_016452 [Gekko kuhli]